VGPGQKLKVCVPVKHTPPRAADAPPPPPPPMLAPKHSLNQWPTRTIEQVQIAVGADVSTADVLELLDMADGDINRAINYYLNRGQSQARKPRKTISGSGGIHIPVAQPATSAAPMATATSVSIPVATPVVVPPVPTASQGSVGGGEKPPPPPSSSSSTMSTAKGSHEMEFKARSFAANEDFGFPENVILSLARGHFTVLDDEEDDLASWPMAHVHDWATTGKHDIEIHVPEGTLEFGIENPEVLLSKLSVIHAALSGN
jgi:hypothetical protein